ncbi:hypothetical protein [Microbacterium terricola]|uniref:Uncharacterized protein n=1 Tax=Microbacterium terricola TaxID=344163 RepID=A0ABM8DY17_9MICO|nr:hypothetical protein [Microbacterium terricola]UYK38826.1 hypothetical protein OAU46_08900 [Microbacterium terricola]BDV30479.1 hypothetical protein Microterr_11390 [Microbacterium terricola]
MRAARWAVALVVAAAICGAAPAAHAADDADDTDVAAPGTAVYAVEVTDISVGPDGDGEPRSTSGEVRIACVGTVCAVVAAPGPGVLAGTALASGALSGETSSDGAGSACTQGRGEREIVVSASDTGFEAHLTQSPLDWEECPDGTDAYGHGRDITWTGALVAADACVFDEQGCLDGAVTASRLWSGDPAAPSVLSGLATPATAGTAPVQLGLAALLAIVLVLLVAFPTALLNSAAEQGSGRLAGWWAGRRARTSGPVEEDTGLPRPRAWLHSWWWAGAGVLAAGIISAFVDPQFGLNPGSARVILSILASFALDVVMGWVVVVMVMRRAVPGATHTFDFQPLTLLIVVLAVVFTRITGFEPGIVFGLVAGVAFGALAGRAQEARVALTSLGYAFVVALVAWVLYGMLGGGAASGESFWGTFTVELLSAAAIGGMAALPIALFPVRGLPGAAVFAWNRWVWGACYLLGLFAFFVVLMPMPFSWAEVSLNLSAWIGLYVVYLVGALLLWLLIARPWDRTADEGERTDGGDAPERVDATDAEVSQSDPDAVASVAVDRVEG